MSRAASSLFGGGAKPDTSALEAQKKLLADQEAKATQDEELRKKKEASAAKARTGRASGSSLLSGLETGVTPVDQGRRSTLG